MSNLTKHLTDSQAGALAAERGDEPFAEGCRGGFADADTAPQDRGSDAPQDLPGIEHFDMAALKDVLRRTAARIERETGFATRCEALVSSENYAGGFLVFMSRDGETFMGNSSDLDGAELQARLKASVWVVEQRKAAAL